MDNSPTADLGIARRVSQDVIKLRLVADGKEIEYYMKVDTAASMIGYLAEALAQRPGYSAGWPVKVT
jgi:hypothetical protein